MKKSRKAHTQNIGRMWQIGFVGVGSVGEVMNSPSKMLDIINMALVHQEDRAILERNPSA